MIPNFAIKKRKEVINMRKLSVLDWTAMVLVIIGGLNWGLVGAFKLDLVRSIFGDMSAFSRIIYIIVGLSAIYVLTILFNLGKMNGNKA